MPDTLLMTKVSLPILRHIFVPREKIIRQLNQGVQEGRLFTLVSAPAGYGKTTTIRMWVQKAEHPVAWVSLEKSDNDLKQFLTYFLTALQHLGDDFGQEALEVVETQEIDLQRVLGLLINDLHELDQKIILVLEDYHLIENKEIDQFIESLLNQAIANLHLVITTREDPNLPLTRLRVRNQLTEIRAADLSFSLEEAGDFFSNVMGVDLPQKETEILTNRTEGWAAGLQLAALSLKESTNPVKFVEAFRGTHRHVLDYLIEEVLNSQSEEVREFLYRTSILDQLSPSLCEAVTGQKASRKYLLDLENNNLFIVSLDEERTWYRYHALFAELLKNQLLQTEPESVDELQKRAADWYQKHGFIQKAVEHAFQISNGNKAFELIEQYAMTMLYQGEVSTVMGWFDKLPESSMRASPMMWVNKAWALALIHNPVRLKEIEQTAQAASDALDLANADQALRDLVAGHIATIQAYLMQTAVLFGDIPEKLIETSQKAQQLLPKNEKAIRSINALNIGFGYLVLGDLASAEKGYREAFENGIAGGNFYAAVYGQLGLIFIALMRGQLKDVLQSCETNIERFNHLLAGQRFPPIGELYSLKGGILIEQNHLAEAEQALAQGLSFTHLTREYEARLRCYSTLARLHSIQGDRVRMLESIKALGEISADKEAVYAQALCHRFSLRDWNVDKTVMEDAQTWMTRMMARLDSPPDMSTANPECELHFQVLMSMAHILTRLAAQNPKAYSLQSVHNYFARQEKIISDQGLYGWLIGVWIIRALMYHAEGKTEEAYRIIQMALNEALPRGYFRVFLDEGDLMRSLLESVEPGLKDSNLSAYVRRLLEAMPAEPVSSTTPRVDDEKLSDRELDVLRLLAAGQSYKEIGKQLFLSLNTVQFHIKSIYRKLAVNKQVQAIERAREMKLI